MKKQDFLKKLQDAINCSHELTDSVELNNLAEWDSLSKVCVISMFEDELKIKMDYSDLEKMHTVDDLIKFAKVED